MTSEVAGNETPTGLEPADPPPAEDRRRLHPAVMAIGALRHARSAAFGMLAVIASQGITVGGVVVLGILAVAAAFSFAEWRATTYAVTGGTLHLETGVFARKEQVVPASRISAVDTTRGILQRIFGVVAVNLQIPGGKKADVTLHAVSFAEAERLRSALGHRGSEPAAGTTAAVTASASAPGETASAPSPNAASSASGPTFVSPEARLQDDAAVVFAMSPRELFVAAITSPSVAFVGAAAAAVFGQLQDALPDRLQHRLGDSVEHLTTAGVLALVAALVVVALVVSVTGTVVLYGGFRIQRDDRRLRIRRGLITERTGTVPLDRVHGVRVVEAPLRQLLGYASIEVEVAGYAGQDEVTRTLVPLVRRSALPELLPQILPGFSWPAAALEPVPSRARRRYLTWPLVVAVPLAIALLVAPIGAGRIASIVPLALAVAYGLRSAADAGWQLDGDQLTLRWRAGSRSTLLARSSRLQRAELHTSPFQRRVALANFGVRLSNARAARVRHLDSAVVHALVAHSGR